MSDSTRRLTIVVCTTPIRPTPTDYPPFGSLAIIQALRGAGYDPGFYDIDGLRPSFEEVERFFRERQPEVLGISAVVSTAYSFTKKLALMVKRVSPRTRIVVGGNLAASAEILHRKAGVDFCVAGEGEVVAVNLMNHLQQRLDSGAWDVADDASIEAVKGISHLNARGEMAFTGYEAKIPAGALFDPDFTILEQHSRIENFITPPGQRPEFVHDPRTYEPHRAGKKVATVIMAKGCVARCTFCHRWDKGYRALPVEHIVARIRHLMATYNVGFIQFGDENFGSDRRQTDALVEALKPLDILYTVAGVRCRSVDPALLRRMKESGCVSVYFGMESGSQRILDVMEKNTSTEDNMNAARWTGEAGLHTVYQIVIGMPGENDETIAETIEFFKQASEFLPESPIKRLSANFIQALPGTPVYEYARARGFIGKSLDDEEKYLELISDVDIMDDTKFLNFTDCDYLTVQSWRHRLILECIHHYGRVKGLPAPSLRDVYRHTITRRFQPKRYAELRRAAAGGDSELDYAKGGYFNLQRSLYYDIISAHLYRLRTPVLWLWMLVREYRHLGLRPLAGRVVEALRHRLAGPPHARFKDYRSARKIVIDIAAKPSTESELAMEPFRAGR